MKGAVERVFERLLWNSRFVVVVAVVGSVAAGFALFYLATIDVFYLVMHLAPYAGDMTEAARAELRSNTVTHVVEVVDGYLLALVMLIFGMGMYELFVSDVDEARQSKTSSKILVIESLDDLKNRLAKVILMIMIVRLFEHAAKMNVTTTLDMLYFGGAIALVGIALYFSHKSESTH